MENIPATYINTPLYQQIRNFLSQKKEENKCIACWSLPQQENMHLIISNEVAVLDQDFELEKMNGGFLIAPFDDDKDDILFLNNDFYWNSDVPFPEDESNYNEPASGDLNRYSADEPLNTLPEHYIDLVKKSLEKIEEGEFIKVVPARAKTTALPEGFNSLDFFLTLCREYPDAFVSWYSIPHYGTWFCASPELIIELKENIFKTVALAGTQAFEPSHSIKETSWTQKEIEEQALVSRYIINCFKKIRLREFDELGPKTVRAGNLLHLKTEYSVNMDTTNFPDLGSVMLKLLHPTSAICGMPLEITRSFIEQNEDFDRGYFAGYLGPVNLNNSTNLYVNLRCLQLIKDQAITYGGAGVTIDSDPAKELNETEIKMNTLIRLLK